MIKRLSQNLVAQPSRLRRCQALPQAGRLRHHAKWGLGIRSKQLLLAVMLPGLVFAQETFESYGPKPKLAEAARQQHEKQVAAHKGDKDKLVLPGLVADKKARTVEVLGEATGLNGNDIIEFLLVDLKSEHGYEALLWSYAKPSDVHRALEFIGLTAGSPVNPGAGRLWSDGDPVAVTVKEEGGEPFAIEDLILDTETGKSLPVAGFVFAGSIKTTDGNYAADLYGPRSIASIYNEPVVVLDVPRQVSQGEVYGKQVVNPDKMLTAGKLFTVLLKPGAAANKRRNLQLALTVGRGAGETGLDFSLKDADGKVVKQAAEVTPALEELVTLKKDGTTPYVTLSFQEGVPVPDVVKTCTLMALLEGMLNTARINPPAAGQLYYRAFVPTKDWLDPAQRPAQPWELHLAKTKDSITAKLVRYDFAAAMKRHEHPVTDPAAMKKQMEAVASMPPVLLVFAEPDLTHGELMKWVAPVQPTHRTIYVFVEAK